MGFSAPTNPLQVRPQDWPTVTGLGGTGCCSTRSSEGSRQAQLGALNAQMLVVGFTVEGSSRFPARTTRN